MDALIDTLYFTFSFVLMGVDPERIFDIVHEANMGKVFRWKSLYFDLAQDLARLEENSLRTRHPTELQRQFKAYERHKERKI